MAPILSDPTLPVSERVLEYMRQLRDNKLSTLDKRDVWKKLKMMPADYRVLRKDTKTDPDDNAYYTKQFRYDYETANSLYTVRNPGCTHREFRNLLSANITRQLKDLIRNNAAAQAIMGLESYDGSSRPFVQLLDVVSSSRPRKEDNPSLTNWTIRQPDLCYKYKDRPYPPIVVEVACSQKIKDLQSLAESYIVDSHHEIKYVIGIDISPCIRPATTPAFVSSNCNLTIWAPEIERDGETGLDVGTCKKIVDAQPFRDADRPLPGSLDIPLSAFLPHAVHAALPPADRNLVISISFAELTHYLDQAMATEPTNGPPLTPKPTMWRKRRRSFSEDVLEDTVAESRRKNKDAPRPSTRKSLRHDASGSVKKEPTSDAESDDYDYLHDDSDSY